MNCPCRYLTADGRVLSCDLSTLAHDVRDAYHSLGFHGRETTSWHAGDPCAWDATCKTCDGAGELTDCGSLIPCPTCDWTAVPCDRCGGAGTVEDVPTSLTGVGSVLEGPVDMYGGPRQSRVVLTEWDADRDMFAGWICGPVIPNDVCVLATEIGTKFRVVRAVPPAAEEPA